ncbi:hypothetical protein MHK_008212, partial [Candidatus Magnetomorum sp. HK-1]
VCNTPFEADIHHTVNSWVNSTQFQQNNPMNFDQNLTLKMPKEKYFLTR